MRDDTVVVLLVKGRLALIFVVAAVVVLSSLLDHI